MELLRITQVPRLRKWKVTTFITLLLLSTSSFTSPSENGDKNSSVMAANDSTVTQTAPLQDVTPPTVITQDITVQLDATGNASISPQDIVNGSSDDSGQVSLSLDRSTFNCSDIGTTSGGLNLNGGQYLDYNINIQDIFINSAFTLEGWFKLDGSDFSYTLIHGIPTSGDFKLQSLGQEIYVMDSRGVNFSSFGGLLTIGRWYHIALVSDFSGGFLNNGSLYLDGELLMDGFKLPSSYLTQLIFGAEHDGSNAMIGSLDELRLWRVARSQVEINATKDLSLSGSEPGLIAYLPLDDGSGMIAQDLSENPGDATLINGNDSNWTTEAAPIRSGNQVVLTATDPSGNSATGTANVIVEDNIAPEITLSGDASITLNPGDTYNEPGATAVDNCTSPVAVTIGGDVVDLTTSGTYTITYNATDDSGNAATQVTRSVTVNAPDITPPTVITHDITVQLDASGNATITPEDIDNGSSDDSGQVSLSLDRTTFECSDIFGVSEGLNLDGQNFIHIPGINQANPLHAGEEFTLEAWVKVSGHPEPVFAFGNASGLDFGFIGGQGVSFRISTVAATVEGPQELETISLNFQEGSWHHVALVGDYWNVSLYIDGNNVRGWLLPSLLNGVPHQDFQIPGLFFGGDFEGNDHNSEGLDELRLWNVARTEAEIRATKDRPLTGSEPGLSGYWPLVGETGSLIEDHSGNNLDAVIIGEFLDPITAFSIPGAPLFGDQLVTLTVTDPSGNAATGSALVRVEDTLGPEITLNGDASITLNPGDTYNELGATAVDNCTNPVEVTIGGDVVDLTTSGTYVVTYDAIDSFGNTATQVTRMVTVNALDITPPTVITQDITVQLDASGNATISPQDIDNGSSDDSGQVSLSLDRSTFDCSDILAVSEGLNLNYENFIHITGINEANPFDAGEQFTLEAWVKVSGAPEPVFAFGNGTLNFGILGEGLSFRISTDAVVVRGGPYSEPISLNFQEGSWHHVAFVGDYWNVSLYIDGNNVREWFLPSLLNGVPNEDFQFPRLFFGGDFEGNIYNSEGLDELRLWNVARTEAEIRATKDRPLTGSEPGLSGYWPLGGETGNLTEDHSGNNMDGLIRGEFPDDPVEAFSIPGTPYFSSQLVILTVTDPSGNAATNSALVLVEDNIAPEITLNGDASITLNPGDTYNEPGATGLDNCTNPVEVAIGGDVVNTAALGSYTVTYNATDAAGNVAEQVTRTVNVIPVPDLIPPTVITQNVTVALDANGNASITADQIDNGSTDNEGIASLAIDMDTFDCSNVGDNTVTLTVTDNSGNVSTGQAIVTVNDVIPPGSTMVQSPLPSAPQLALDNVAEAADYGILYQLDIPNSAQWTTGVPYTIDNSGLSDLDFDRVAYLLQLDNEWVWVSMDAFTQNLEHLGLPQKQQTGRNFNHQQIVNNLSVAASAGTGLAHRENVATGNIEIWNFNYGVDNQANVPNASGTIYDWGDIRRTTGGYSSFQVHDHGAQEVLLAYNRWGFGNGNSDIGIGNNAGNANKDYTFQQNAGNFAVKRLYVLVDHTPGPGILTNDITVQLDANGQVTITAEQIDADNTDSCGGEVTLSIDQDTFTCDNLGANTVVLTVTDASGNSASGMATVTVEDNVGPIITLNGDAEVDVNIGDSYREPGAVANDSCTGPAAVTFGGDVVDTNVLGSYVVTYDATDASGNAATQITRTVNVIDNVDPVITANDITVNNDAGLCGATIASFGVTATDNAGTPTLSFDIPEGSTFNVGTTQVTATADDGNGNTAQAIFNVTVNDVEAPMLTLIGDAVVNLNFGAVYTELSALANDNCSTTLTIGGDVVNTTAVGTYVVTYDAVDPSGNTAVQVTRTINVIDNIAPLIAANDITVNNDAGICGAVINSFGVTATDNAGTPSLSFDIPEGSNFNVGTTQVTATADDGNGNTAQSTFNVTVNDAEAPIITLNGDAVVNLNFGAPYTELSALTNNNCSATLTIGGDVVNTTAVGTYVVTYDAIDPSGNTAAQVTRTVNVVDNIAPVITANDITVNNDTGVCGALINSFGVTATDNAGTPSLSFDIPEGSNLNVGTTQVTATADDGNGNTAQATFNVTVNDTENPTILLNGDAVVNLNFGDTYSELSATVNDNCSATLTIGGDVVNTAAVGTYVVTYDAIDPSGNTAAQVTRTVNVIDNVAPVITANDITVNNDNGVCGALINSFGVTATDNAGTPSLSFDIPEGSNFNVGTTQVTATADDGNGNTAQATFNVTVNDTENPTILLNGDAVVNLNFGDTYSELSATVNDNCSATLTIGGDVVNTAAVGTYVVTYNALDPSGNAAIQVTRTVNVIDNVAPVITANDITVNNYAGICGAVINSFGITATDNAGIPTLTFDIPEGSNFNVGTTQVTASADDGNGNVAQATFDVIVVDVETPTVSLNGDAVININQNEAFVETATAQDNCSATLQITGTVNTAIAGTYQLTYVATDGSGNTSQPVSRTVNVLDVTPPVIVAQDLVIELDANGNATITPGDVDNGTTDNSGSVSLSLDQSTFDCTDVIQVGNLMQDVSQASVNTAGGQAAQSFVPQKTGFLKTVQLDWRNLASTVVQGEIQVVTNNADDTDVVVLSSQTFDIPVGFNLVDITFEDPAFVEANTTYAFRIVDAGGASVRYRQGSFYNQGRMYNGVGAIPDPSGSVDDWYFVTQIQELSAPPTQVTLTATDPSGNTSSASVNISVLDRLVPQITAPADVNVLATSAAGAVLNYVAPVGTDNCAVTTALTAGLASGATFPIGTTTVTHTATDACGNAASASFNVTVTGLPPQIVVPVNITVNTDPGECGAIVNFEARETTAIPASTIAYDIQPGSFFAVGTTTVTATATNPVGTSSASFTVTVEDNVAPEITAPADINIFATSAAGAVVNYATPVGTDNCAVTTALTAGLASGATFPIGTTTVTHTATDASGNTASASFNVTVTGISPQIVVPANITVSTDLGECGAIVSYQATETTAIPASTITYDIQPGSFFAVGTTTVTATATNPVGTSSASFTVTVEDNEAPTVVTQNIIVDLDANGNASITAAQINNGSTDPCGIAGMSLSQTDFNCSHVGDNTVTLTVTDIHGNSASQTATVTVNDVTAPTVITQNITVQLDVNGNATITPQDIDNGSSDACGIASTTIDISSFDCSNIGQVNTVTLTATDVNGNVETGTAFVTVSDITAPTLSLQDITIALGIDGTASIDAQQLDNGSVDNCGIASWSVDRSVFTCADIDATGHLVTVTATDNAGNLASGQARVFVTDVIGPEISGEVIRLALADNGLAVLTDTQVLANLTDNCGVASFELSKSSFSCADLGTQAIPIEVTDIHGNVTTGVLEVEVVDEIAPVFIKIPRNITRTASGNCTARVFWSAPQASDNCEVQITSTHSSGQQFPVGTTTVTLTATDMAGNSVQESFDVTVKSRPMFITVKSVSDVSCSGGSDGAVRIKIIGGCGPYTYTWSNGATTRDLNNVPAGRYTLTVTDAGGRTKTKRVTVREPKPVKLKLRVTPKRPARRFGEENTIYLGYGDQRVTISSKTSGGTGNKRVEWTNDQSSRVRRGSSIRVSPRVTTTYTATATDRNGCSTTTSVTITVVDVRAGGGRVYVCLNGNTLAVSERIARRHLKAGAKLGRCNNGLIMQAPALNIETSDKTEESTTGQSELLKETLIELQASPNPTQGKTNIVFSANQTGPARVVVYNMQGIEVAKLYEGQIEAGKDYTIVFDARREASGMLLVRVQTQGQVKTLKLLIKK